jgi:hypothetical protein
MTERISRLTTSQLKRMKFDGHIAECEVGNFGGEDANGCI